jgi:transmembrane sensor
MTGYENDSVKKWMEGTLSGDEKKRFEQTLEFKKLERMLGALASFKAPEYNVEEGFAQLKSKLPAKLGVVNEAIINSQPKRAQTITMMSWLSPVLKIAAVLVLAVGGYFLFSPEKPTEVKTIASQKTEITLPDRSTVALNAASSISYLKDGWANNRKVVLDGEAFFKVAKGSRFDVQTSVGTVSVLGTQFNVKNRKGYFEVTCFEGLVEVVSAGKSVKLSAKNVFRVINGTVARDEVTSVTGPGWMKDESTFKSVPFSQVLRELERQYNVTISVEKIDTSKLFTGTFSNSDLTVALKSIANPFNLTFQITGNTIVLHGSSK